jgi:hypothetical protein
MTLYEQIIQIHAKHFNPEFHAYRQGIVPAMLNDLALRFFDSMTQTRALVTNVWALEDSVDVRAVKKARALMASPGHLRESEPAVE